jgi:hypothetical protein
LHFWFSSFIFLSFTYSYIIRKIVSGCNTGNGVRCDLNAAVIAGSHLRNVVNTRSVDIKTVKIQRPSHLCFRDGLIVKSETTINSTA